LPAAAVTFAAALGHLAFVAFVNGATSERLRVGRTCGLGEGSQQSRR
jgi:hypothetical protein